MDIPTCKKIVFSGRPLWEICLNPSLSSWDLLQDAPSAFMTPQWRKIYNNSILKCQWKKKNNPPWEPECWAVPWMPAMASCTQRWHMFSVLENIIFYYFCLSGYLIAASITHTNGRTFCSFLIWDWPELLEITLGILFWSIAKQSFKVTLSGRLINFVSTVIFLFH